MRGAPNDLSSRTLRPFGPSVTRTACASVSMPCNILSRASTENFTSLAAIIFPPDRDAHSSQTKLSSSFFPLNEEEPLRFMSGGPSCLFRPVNGHRKLHRLEFAGTMKLPRITITVLTHMNFHVFVIRTHNSVHSRKFVRQSPKFQQMQPLTVSTASKRQLQLMQLRRP